MSESKDQYGVSELEDKKFSAIDIQYLLNELRSSKLTIDKLKARIAELEEAAKSLIDEARGRDIITSFVSFTALKKALRPAKDEWEKEKTAIELDQEINDAIDKLGEK